MVATCDAAGLLLASEILIMAPAFALALWMLSSFCLTMALLALAFLTVLVLALVLALTQLSGCLSTTLWVALIDWPMPLERRPTPPRLRGDLILASVPTHPALHQCLHP